MCKYNNTLYVPHFFLGNIEVNSNTIYGEFKASDAVRDFPTSDHFMIRSCCYNTACNYNKI